PGGGGNKELYQRLLEQLPEGSKGDLQKVANQTFETIAMAKVSTSAHEAAKLGFLRPQDGLSVNGDHLLHDAKNQVLALAAQGYQPPQRKKLPIVGEAGYATLALGAQTMHFSQYISDHDLKIAKKLAYVIAGGKLPAGTLVDEQYLLDLEREAFLSLAGEPKSQARMQHMLVKGKPLRN
ncbi:3-hydroxyacyl-CoA dehydrogenase, partial [Fictibacillus aquaticus]